MLSPFTSVFAVLPINTRLHLSAVSWVNPLIMRSICERVIKTGNAEQG